MTIIWNKHWIDRFHLMKQHETYKLIQTKNISKQLPCTIILSTLDHSHGSSVGLCRTTFIYTGIIIHIYIIYITLLHYYITFTYYVNIVYTCETQYRLIESNTFAWLIIVQINIYLQMIKIRKKLYYKQSCMSTWQYLYNDKNNKILNTIQWLHFSVHF